MAEARLAWLGLRGQRGRAIWMAACLGLGVAARVSVGSFMGQVERALTKEARILLSADLEIAGLSPLNPGQSQDLKALLPKGAGLQQRASFLSVLRAPSSGRSRLCQLSAVEEGYPFHGRISFRDKEGKLYSSIRELPHWGNSLLVAAELLPQLKIKAGQKVKVGARTFEVAGVIEEEPGFSGAAFSLGPRVLMPFGSLASTGLSGFGSRISYETLVALNKAEEAEPLKKALAAKWGLADGFSMRGMAPPTGSLRVRSFNDAQAEIKSFFDRMADFLRLASLLALLMGGVGVASVVRGLVREQHPQFGVLKSLGMTPWGLAKLVLWQGLLMGLGGILGGLALGLASQSLLPALLKGFLPLALDPVLDFKALAAGFALGATVCLVFSFIPALDAGRSGAASLLRDEEAKSSKLSLLLASLAALLFCGLAALEARSLLRGSAFVGTLIVAAGLLWGLGLLLLKFLSRFRGASFALRHAFANLGRHARKSAPALVALGLAGACLGVLLIYERSLLSEIDPAKRAGEMPSLFLIDVQKSQLPALKQAVSAEPRSRAIYSPMVKARYRGINGRESEAGKAWSREAQDGQRMRSREQNLSFRPEPSRHEKIVQGKWMDPKGEELEASLEEWFAKQLGAKLGSYLRFDVSGLELEAKVTSIRKVDWASFEPNFFILLSPWSLEEAPQTWIASIAGLDEGSSNHLQSAVAARLPNVTVIDVAEGSRKVMGILHKVTLAIRVVAAFALFSGLAVLFGIALSSARARRAEAALLKALGAGPRELFTSLGLEFSVMGMLAASLGMGLSLLLGWLLTHFVVKVPFQAPWQALAILGTGVGLASGFSGILAAFPALREKPLAVLREE